MKNCLLFVMAFILFTKTEAQEDTTVSFSTNPVSSFQVQSHDRVVLLKWSVEGSEEFKSFDIERADNAALFMKVGSKLAISKNSDGEYDFVDATPKRNIPLRYRLKLISKDGFVTYSDIKETKVADAPWTVRLKQNPVRNNIEFEIESSLAKPASVTVISHSGQQVASQTFRLSTGKNALSLFSQAMLQGIYQLIVEVGNDRKTIPFIKE